MFFVSSLLVNFAPLVNPLRGPNMWKSEGARPGYKGGGKRIQTKLVDDFYGFGSCVKPSIVTAAGTNEIVRKRVETLLFSVCFFE